MASLKGIFETVAGGAMIAAGVLIEIGTLGGGTPLAMFLISAGAGMVLNGVGTLIQGQPVKGFATAVRNSIAPWVGLYGRVRTGGTVVYVHNWGDNNQVLDLVIVLAAHSCQIDANYPVELLFDQQRIQIDTTAIPTTARAGYSVPDPVYGSGTSFTPVQQTVGITSIGRTDDVVTVALPDDIPYLVAGDQVQVQNVPGDLTLNGIVQVAEITNAPSGHVGGAVGSGGPGLTFTYLSGGVSSSVLIAGQVVTRWADYGRNVYVEYLNGRQGLGSTFVGMTAGAPWQGTGKLSTPASPQNAGGTPLPNPWTAYCSLQGKTAVFLRLKYDQSKFPSGLPQISFHLYGKNDIYDSRLGDYGSPSSAGYTENAALIIADFLSNQTWGFKAAYGTEIDLDALSAQADICDQAVTLANGGTEPRYTANGQFQLTTRRGEILQNLLTSCAGRLTYLEGKFAIQVGRWPGLGSPPAAVNLTAIAAAPYRWRSTVATRDLYNGVKGTYISPANKWQSTDFPYYAQDTLHGFSGPVEFAGDILLAADGGERRWLELHLPFTISASMAQRIAKIELLRRRGKEGTMIDSVPGAGYGGSGTFPLTMAGYRFVPLDIFEATVPFLGFTNKLLEVAAVRFRVDEQSDNGITAMRLGTEIDVQETDSSIYDWSIEEELSAQGYRQTRWPQGVFQEIAPFPWAPGYVSPLTGDAYGGPATFGLQPGYGLDNAGIGTASLQVKGAPPINDLDTGISPPQIAVTVGGGGSIAAGTYVIGVSAKDGGSSTAANSDYLDLAVLDVPDDSSSITVDVTWGSGDDGGELYVGFWNADGYVMHYQQSIDPGTPSVTLASFDQTTAGGPDHLFDHFGVVVWRGIHLGSWAEQVQAVTSNTVTIASLASGDVGSDDYAGCVLSLLAKYDSTLEIPVLNLPIAGNSASSGTPAEFTLTIGSGADGSTLPDLTTLLAIGDLMVMRFNSTFAADSFTDARMINWRYPSGTSGVEAGHLAMVLTGPDAGDVQTIAEVSGGDVVQLAGTWNTTPNSGDLVVIVAPSSPETPSGSFLIPNRSILSSTPPIGAGVVAQPDVLNLGGQAWVLGVRTEDVDGKYGPDSVAPKRDLFLFGTQGTRIVTTSGDELPTDGTVVFDTSAGDITFQCLPAAQHLHAKIYYVKVSTDAHTVSCNADPDEAFTDGATSFTLSAAGDNQTINWHG